MLGRSMGGGVTLNALVAEPGLVDAAVVYAAVSSRFLDNLDHFTRPNRPEAGGASRPVRHPAGGAGFYRGLSSRTYFDRITEPVLMHHGTDDETCPSAWARTTQRLLGGAGVDAGSVYDGREARLLPRWQDSIEPDRAVPAPAASSPDVRGTRRSPLSPACGLPWRQHRATGTCMTERTRSCRTRRLDAVRAWTGVRRARRRRQSTWCAPRSCAAGHRSEAAITRRRHRGAAGRRGRHRGVLAGLPAPDRRRAGRGRAAAYRRGRRPRHRGHRRRDPHPLDVRRPGDAPQGRDRQLRGRRPLGRRERRHQRPRPRQPHRRARRWCSAPSTSPRSCTTGSAGPRPCTTRSPAQQLGVIDLSTTWDRTHPIGLATARVMARLIETAMPRSQQYAGLADGRRARRARPACCRCSAPPRRGSTASGCCSTAARPRSSRCSPCTPRGSRWSTCTRCVYGDQAVTLSTLKAEVSHLRSRARRPARLAPLPADDAGVHRRRRGARPAAPRRRRGGRRRRTAATCCPAPTRRP